MKRSRDSPFSTRTVGWIASISVVSFLLAFILAGFGEDLGSPGSARSDAFSYSALGHRGFVELLNEIGLPATVRRSAAAGAGPDLPLLALEPSEDRTEGGPTVGRLYEEARGSGATLFVALPKWRGVPQLWRPTWVERVRARDADPIVEEILPLLEQLELDGVSLALSEEDPADVECESSRGERFRVVLRRAQLFDPSPLLESIVDCPEGVLVARVPSAIPPIYFLSDPDVLNNQGIHRGDHGRLLASLFRDSIGARGVVIDEMHHGFVQRVGLLAELLRFPLVIGVAHGLLLIGIVIWAGAGRVGKPLPPPSILRGGKVALIDNAAQLLAGSGHSVRSVRRYLEQSLRQVGAHFFIPAELAHDELVDRLQRITESRGVRFDLLGASRRAATLQQSGGSAERSVRLAMDIYRWREELTNGTRTDP